MVRRSLAVLVSLGLATALAACAPTDDTTDAGTATGDAAATDGAAATPTDDVAACSPDTLQTLQAGTLTIATDEPAFEPWMVDNDPSNGEGFESAVAYAVAEELGYAEDEVEWVRVPFNAAIQPGPKTFDFDINQFSITEKRKQAVDFSSPYYDVQQAVIAVRGTPGGQATSLDDLAGLQLGAQVGTTSLDAIEQVVQPEKDPLVYNSNNDAVEALKNDQIDALVLDLPTAFFATAVQVPRGVIVGQLPPTPGTPEQFGLVLDKGSPLTECVSQAVDALREDGTLADLENTWLADVAGAPVLQ
jgi:polar amino acid transport system substrate-binding protein